MSLTFSTAVAAPLLIQEVAVLPSGPAASSGAASDFAALLESLDFTSSPLPTAVSAKTQTADSKKTEPTKSEAKPSTGKPRSQDEKEAPAANWGTPIVIALPESVFSKTEPLPLELHLPTGLPPQDSLSIEEGDSKEKPITPDLQLPLRALTRSPEQTLEHGKPELYQVAPQGTPPLLAPLVLSASEPQPPPSPRSGTKSKAPISPLMDPPSLLPAASPKSEGEIPSSEIAFEAKLTPKGSNANAPSTHPVPLAEDAPSHASPLPQAAVEEESKPRQKTATQEPARDPQPDLTSNPVGHASAAHISDAPAKTLFAPTATVPATHTSSAPDSLPPAEKTLPASTTALDLPDLPAPRTEPARDISFRINSTAADAIDVKLVDRAGQVHVAVRSADPVLTQSLQTNVSELASKLERSGFQTETFIPGQIDILRDPRQSSAFQDFQQQQHRAPQQDQQRKRRPAPNPVTFSLTPNQEKQ